MSEKGRNGWVGAGILGAGLVLDLAILPVVLLGLAVFTGMKINDFINTGVETVTEKEGNQNG